MSVKLHFTYRFIGMTEYTQRLHHYKCTSWILYCLFPSHLIQTQPACPRSPLDSASNPVVYQSDRELLSVLIQTLPISANTKKRSDRKSRPQKVDWWSPVFVFGSSNEFSWIESLLCAFKGEIHRSKSVNSKWQHVLRPPRRHFMVAVNTCLTLWI